ncbi:hypothetical protein RhiirC2_794957 [Rhizophagus irregularis]|uniref:TLDc domain-containing protein n=1 Tax=Rhizophagus irregularis TaxID=588596 RepID=A0A2N1MCJ5_9GLOM|nr:hypothetical protein RhiirC2_794957 [Rhizophagus irregularis]
MTGDRCHPWLSLDEKDTSDLLKVLATADKLSLQELVDYLQGYLIENKSEQLEQYFELAQQISSNSNNLLRLPEFCTNLMVQSPDKVLKSLNFTSFPEKSLISLIKSDNLQMKEIEIWEHVLKWGLAQNPTLIPDPKTWSDDDFKTMKNTLQHCLPFVRFFCLSPKEFSQKVRPYQKLLNQQLYEDILNFYLDPESVSSHNIQLPRKIKINENTEEVICSLIVNSGSRDGFTPKKFHELCDNKPNTVTFIKIKGTKEIIGGYNLLEWKSFTRWDKTKDSFIFSFKNKNNFKDAILSKVVNSDRALWFSYTTGPYFGNDINIIALNHYTDYVTIKYCKRFYEKKIRDSEGEFTIEDYEDTSDLLKVLATADKLSLQELVDYLQGYLIENKSEQLEQYFELAQQISSNSNNLLRLPEFCTNLMVQSPDKVLKSLNFTSFPEKSLISLIKSDNLQMKEIEIWEHVLKWGLAQNPTLIPDPKTWSDDDFKTMKNTLQHCLPFVRFFCLSPKEFSQKVRPYQKLLNQQLYEDILNFYLDPESVSSHNIQLPRKIKINENTEEVICSLIVNSGSRDGFTPKKFHELCDNKPNTVTFIKIKGTKEIIGGYNLLEWKSFTRWDKTKDSFIFSFKNKNNFKDAILSKVVNSDRALWFSYTTGPYFGNDINIIALNHYTDYVTIKYCKRFYEKKIRDSEGEFTIEDYEVFQIIKK